MTKRTLNLDVQEYLEECSAFLESFDPTKWDESSEEFQRLILNGLTLSMLWGNHECALSDEKSLTHAFYTEEEIGIGQIVRYAYGVSVPLGRLQRSSIRRVVAWFRDHVAETERKKRERDEEKRRFFADMAARENKDTVYNWVRVCEESSDDFSQVALWVPCPRSRWLGGRAVPMVFSCEEEEIFHGHIALSGEDGIGIVPAKIESRAYLKEVCDYGCKKGWMPTDERNAIFSLPEVQLLAEEMTDRERRVVNETDGLEKATKFCFIGF